MHDRRQFLGALGVPAAAFAARAWLDPAAARARRASLAAFLERDDPPDELARDEDLWREVALAFTVDRSCVNLNNGGVSPAPAVVQEATKRHLDHSHTLPPYVLWQVLEPRKEGVRQRLAREWGVDPEEIAITRNASEGLQICQLGLDLEPGDEVLTTNQDYPRMISTFLQRERREGIVLRRISIPTPCEDPAEVVRRFRDALTERTRCLLVCQVVNLTGQVLPVREIVAMARERGVPTIVDGAHGFAHLDFRLPDLDCDFYATSLHKWLFAPHGTGLLYVRRERIPDLWPLMAAPPGMEADVRKFEEIGTHPAAGFLAVAEALTFHQTIGGARKLARLVHLRDRWARRLLERERVRLHTSLAPGMAGGIATVQLEGVPSDALAAWLWSARRILVTPILHEELEGVRVSPSVYTTSEEIDRFSEALEHVLDHGLPA